MNAIPLSELAFSNSWQENFMVVLPAVRTHAQIRFRRLRPERREEAIAETIAAACHNYQHLACQGRLRYGYISTLGGFAVRHAVQGRHVGGQQDGTNDVMSPRAQKRRGFVVRNVAAGNNYEPVVSEDKHFSPADTAAFRLDFSTWLEAKSRRDRRIIAALAAGGTTTAVARQFRLSLARISQLRRLFERNWCAFQGEVDAQEVPAARDAASTRFH